MTQDDLDIRYTNVLDISYLRRWLQDPKILRWFPMSDPQEIEGPISCWMSFARYNASLTATYCREPCGMATLFLMPYKKVSHHCFFKLCVAPQYQRKGVGTSLLRNIKHLAKTQFNLQFLYIEVFEGNPLISLLKKMEFEEVLRQENYVKIEGQYISRILFRVDLQQESVS